MDTPPHTTTTWKYLAPNPKSLYTQLFVTGTRIRARDLYGHFMCAEDPWTPEFISEQYNVPLEAVKEAIAYCQTDPPEIRDDFERDERLMDASGVNDPDYKLGGKFKLVPPQAIVRILNS
jgi:uncharacterized protein (DUF433 family)